MATIDAFHEFLIISAMLAAATARGLTIYPTLYRAPASAVTAR
jgi:hypothetical protein